MTTQQTFTFGNLQITQTVIIGKNDIMKNNDVERFNGTYWETLSPMDEDYTKAIILMHNAKNS